MRKSLQKRLIGLFLIGIFLLGSIPAGLAASAGTDTLNRANWDASMALRAEGDHLVNGRGEIVRLTGVNVSSLESVATGDGYFWDHYYLAIEDWQSNCLRINLHPKFWSNSDPAVRKQYREYIDKAVSEAVRYGVYVVLDDHGYFAPDETDRTFWKEMAERYGNCPNVIFGLYNEPHDVTWDEWRNGSHGEIREAVDWMGNHIRKAILGMQDLLEAIRSVGAKNLVTVTTLNSGSVVDGLLTQKALLTDTTGNGVIYEIHHYGYGMNYEERHKEVLGKVPLYMGEFNANNGPHKFQDAIEPWDLEDDESRTYMTDIMDFIDKWELSFTAWTLSATFPPMLLDTDFPTFNPSASGLIVKNYISRCNQQQNVRLYTGNSYSGSSLALMAGRYTEQQLKNKGFDVGRVASIAAGTGAYRYNTTFYSGPDCTGKSVAVYSSSKALSLDFVPRSVVISRSLPDDLLTGSRVTVSSGEATKAALTDGTNAMWISSGSGNQTVLFDLQKTYWLDRIVLYHAACDKNFYGYYNTSDFSVSVSADGKTYTAVENVKSNKAAKNDYTFEALPGRYIRIVITRGNRMETDECRLLEVKAYGAPYSGKSAGMPVPIGEKTVYLTDGADSSGVSDGDTADSSSGGEPDSLTPEAPADTSEPTTAPTKQNASKKASAGFWLLPAAIGGGVVLLLAGGAIIWFLCRKKRAVNSQSE